MSEKKNSAVQRVFKSVVGPALGTSLVLLVGCSTSAPPSAPETKGGSEIPRPGQQEVVPVPGVVAPATQGAVVTPTTAPILEVGIVRPEIPEPGKIMPPVGKVAPEKVGKVAPEIHKVGKVAPEIHKVGKVAPEKVGQVTPEIRKVGKFADPDIIRPVDTVPSPGKVGTIAVPEKESSLQAPEERPTRVTRRTTDESGGVLRTGFVGGRKLT